MRIINKIETKILIVLSTLLLMGVGVIGILVNKYSYITLSHFVETCRQLVHTSLPFVEHLSGTLAISLPILSSVLLFLYVLTSYVKTQLRIKKLLVKEVQTQTKFFAKILRDNHIASKDVKVIKYEKPLAVTYGFLKQKVLISDWMINNLSGMELEAVLLHEIYHIKNRHLPIYLLGQVTGSILFYFPVVAGFIKNMKFKLEKEADNYTKQKQNTAKHLKSALIKTLLSDDSLSLLPNFSANLYENRINAITGQKSYSFVSKRQIGLTIVSLVFLSTLYFLPTTVHATAGEHIEPGVCTTNTDCGTHCNNEIQQSFTPAHLQSLVK